MKVDRIVCGYLEENCYVISNEAGEALIVDPGENEALIEKFIKKNSLTVKGILITHYHFDHVGALEYFKNLYEVKVFDIKKIGKNKVHGFSFETFETKGHTEDSCSFYFPEHEMIFVGDFVFKESIGRYDFPDSSFTEMQKSISWIKTLPKKTIIYPGHGDETTLGYEIRHNMFFN